MTKRRKPHTPPTPPPAIQTDELEGKEVDKENTMIESVTRVEDEGSIQIPKFSDIAGVTAPIPSERDLTTQSGPDEEPAPEDENLDDLVGYDDILQRQEQRRLEEHAAQTPTYTQPPLPMPGLDIPTPIAPLLKPAPEPEYSSLTHIRLNEAWNYLSLALQSHVRDAIRFNADLLHIPEWQLVCGLIVHMWQSASLTTPVLDPSWRSSNPVTEALSKCAECGQEFKPRFRNQPYCSSPCGKAAETRRIKAEKGIQ